MYSIPTLKLFPNIWKNILQKCWSFKFQIQNHRLFLRYTFYGISKNAEQKKYKKSKQKKIIHSKPKKLFRYDEIDK